MSGTRKEAYLHYGLAVLLSAAAHVATLLLFPYMAPTLFPVFLCAVMVSAWTGGLGPGLVSTALCALSSAHFMGTSEHFSLGVGAADFVRLLVFAVAALIISTLNSARKQTQEELLRVNRRLDELLRERTRELFEAQPVLRQHPHREPHDPPPGH